MFWIKKKPVLFSAFRPKAPWGGSHIFTGHLLRFLESRGWKISYDISGRMDVAYSTGWFLQGDALDAVTRKAPLLFRMDGLPSQYRGSADNDTLHHEDVMRKNVELARHVIFQSQYCRTSCSHWKCPNHSVILNGTDTRVFYPDISRRADPSHLRFASASWSSSPLKGMPDFRDVAERLPQHEFHFMGRWPEGLDPGRVILHEPGSPHILASFLRGCDVFMHLARHDPCPNILIEAMASGLFPVVHPTGGSKELIGEGFIWEGIDMFMKQALDLPRHLQDRNFLRPELRMENVGENYLQIIESLRATPIGPF